MFWHIIIYFILAYYFMLIDYKMFWKSMNKNLNSVENSCVFLPIAVLAIWTAPGRRPV